MTSESEAMKTKEFQRRRKLRIQQVREQSKEIAKKIRLHARVEKLRHIGELDARKEQEYLQAQGKLVKRLEHLYAKSLQNVGESHKNASVINLQDNPVEKVDHSRKRGQTAVAELRKKKQEQLDQKKKVLDRKLQARETANELSREKLSTTAGKLLGKAPSSKSVEGADGKTDSTDKQKDDALFPNDKPVVEGCDMGTQWDFVDIPNEWQLHIPELCLSKDDSLKDAAPKNMESRTEIRKRHNLFALSDEMPSSLRGGLSSVPEERNIPEKPSLTLVSEHLQNRALRLREHDVTKANKKHINDLQSIKQTLLRIRSSKPEDSNKPNDDNMAKPSDLNSALSTKTSVTMYNHFTRDSKSVPCGDKKFVTRNPVSEDDAYSQAMKESSQESSKDRDHQKKLQEMRNKIAVTKQTVEKEYKDTMSFLNSLPKDKTKVNKKVYMDEHRLQLHKEKRQQKMQQQYRKIQNECRRNNTSDKTRTRSKSPVNVDSGEGFDSNDFYSWMPVPESDGGLAIHTIPTKLKDDRGGNNVKFSRVDSYHEYRSRHKHTPPTKDTTAPSKPTSKHRVTKVYEQSDDQFTDTSSSYSDTSSEKNLQYSEGKQNTKNKSAKKKGSKSLGTERIVIYKILDEKIEKTEKEKQRSKFIDDITKSLTNIEKDKILKALNVEPSGTKKDDKQDMQSIQSASKIGETAISLEQLNEGIYKAVKGKGDNITSMYFSDNGAENESPILDKSESRHTEKAQDNHREEAMNEESSVKSSQYSETRSQGKGHARHKHENSSKETSKSHVAQPSEAASTMSFRTAANDKHSIDERCIKVLDDGGQEKGKFYIEAADFLKNEAYEVVIQLRKKEEIKKAEKEERITNNTNDSNTRQSLDLQETRKGNEPDLEVHSNLFQQQTLNAKESNSKTVSTQYDQTIPHSGFSDKLPSKTPNIKTAVHTANNNLQHDERPTTSMYTQTSFNTPDPVRPALIHMSSSTSTAYMSPPEMILPTFLKRYEKISGEINNHVLHSEGIQYIDQSCDDCETSTCKSCIHARRIIISKPIPKLKKTVQSVSKTKTSPVTTTNGSTNGFSVDRTRNCSQGDHTSNKIRDHSAGYGSKMCRKRHSGDKLASNKRPHRRNSVTLLNSKAAACNKYTNRNITRNGKIINKTNLNPTVKTYVHKLLSLNKESLKAVDVMNQDCSSVATPGSSVIDDPRNIDANKPILVSNLSLERIKSLLMQQFLESCEIRKHAEGMDTLRPEKRSRCNFSTRTPKKRSLHKIKSLNISKNIFKHKLNENLGRSVSNISSEPAPVRKADNNTDRVSVTKVPKMRSKSSPSPRQTENEFKVITTLSDTDNKKTRRKCAETNYSTKSDLDNKKTGRKCSETNDYSTKSDIDNRKTGRSCAETNKYSTKVDIQKGDLSFYTELLERQHLHGPITTETNSKLYKEYRHKSIVPQTTQTNKNIDKEIDYMRLAEDKIQNMEKFADLTEKCTKRLSNLAKVLDEVRKNKSLGYSQISDSASDSDRKLDKNNTQDKPFTSISKFPNEVHDSVADKPQNTAIIQNKQIQSCDPLSEGDTTISENFVVEDKNASEYQNYVPLLTNIPKLLATTDSQSYGSQKSNNSINTQTLKNISEDRFIIKSRGKPPAALSRLHLKHGEDCLDPHELSTVLEVDSPSVTKHKNESIRHNVKSDVIPNVNPKFKDIINRGGKSDDNYTNPDLVESNIKLIPHPTKASSVESLDDSKLQMMDLKQFNEIMLKPFISIREYAKQCHGGAFDDSSNVDDIPKDDAMTDDVSSIHSDVSLPDVIAELLKRNIISEPFKFDTASNVNTTTGSSESSLSVLALSKVRKGKKKPNVSFQNKENIAETSDTLSISSNPDLENAFKKLGMGWASSTLKKTKERLALSSSSNTSSSSGTRFKLKSFNNHDNIPVVVSDSISTLLKEPIKHSKLSGDISKNAQQQTSLKNMTVKEFLTNELAKKITFTNKSHRNDTEEEFVSLYETKMPEEMKHASQMGREERSIDSGHNGSINRARTSTPVQIFKSMTYNSTSSSNASNAGLFSNADDLSSVKGTSNSLRNHSTSDKDDLTIPNYSLRMKKDQSDCSKSD